MSRSQNHRSKDNKMMHSNIMFNDRERESGYASSNRKQKMKRMEELSHSLDDGLNILPDDYGRVQQRSNRGRVEQHYDDMDDDEYADEDYIDDYYYSNSKSNFDGRPKSYNEKYSYGYDEYEASGANFNRNRYSLNDNAMNKNPRYVQQSPVSQQKYSSLRKPQANVTAQQSSSSGNGHHGSNKHILFNDEDDVMYMSEQKKKSSSSSSSTGGKKSVATSSGKKETKESSAPSPSSSTKKKPSKESSEKTSSLQVMKAKLKIHNVTNDDSVLHMRTSKLQNAFHRHHSVESKMPPSPSHHSDRSNMSPTIMEEIEFEVQDDEIETEQEKEVEKKGKSSKDKDKKGNNSAPSTPTTMKSFKAHLSNHKKLFKVPDIDLNNLKLSCFFNKNIAALKGKKEESVSKSVEALNAAEPSSSSKSSPTTKNPPASLKTPPLSPKKIIKSESKADKSIQDKQERANASAGIVVEEKYEKISKLDINDFEDEEEEEEFSISDGEFQVI